MLFEHSGRRFDSGHVHSKFEILRMSKTCTHCGLEKPIDEFYPGNICKKCVKLRTAEWAKQNPDKRRKTVRRWCQKNREKRRAKEALYRQHREKMRGMHLRRKFWPQLSWKDALSKYDQILEQQNYCCAVCESPKGDSSLHIDHDHESGQIRGLLCSACNRGLGYLKDNPYVCLKAYLYLRKRDNSEAAAS